VYVKVDENENDVNDDDTNNHWYLSDVKMYLIHNLMLDHRMDRLFVIHPLNSNLLLVFEQMLHRVLDRIND